MFTDKNNGPRYVTGSDFLADDPADFGKAGCRCGLRIGSDRTGDAYEQAEDTS
jgi:hypothetical protein